MRLFHFTQPIMMSCGVVIGWTYLRFYQSHGKGMRGDMGEGFAFATLLPKPLRYVCFLNIFLCRIYYILIIIIIIKFTGNAMPLRTADLNCFIR